MKAVTIVGARPQFIKAGPVSAALRRAGVDEIIVHTGQHYDSRMSQIFFDELSIPAPSVNLGVGSASHGVQTAQMLAGIEPVLERERPDCVIVYGDTNSTLAGAVATCKLGIPLAHVEAGLRSFNRSMPEEHNRVLTDHCSDLLFCPTAAAVRNLEVEGIREGVHLVGDPMFDALRQFAPIASRRSSILADLGLTPRQYLLATVHRAYNTDSPEQLRAIVSALEALPDVVVFPVHPRTAARIEQLGLAAGLRRLKLVEPVSYLDMLCLEQHARIVLTDSGGVQKEAFFLGIPCVTLRPETEWIETVESGMNVLAGTDPSKIYEAVTARAWPSRDPSALPLPDAPRRIAEILASAVASRVAGVS